MALARSDRLRRCSPQPRGWGRPGLEQPRLPVGAEWAAWAREGEPPHPQGQRATLSPGPMGSERVACTPPPPRRHVVSKPSLMGLGTKASRAGDGVTRGSRAEQGSCPPGGGHEWGASSACEVSRRTPHPARGQHVKGTRAQPERRAHGRWGWEWGSRGRAPSSCDNDQPHLCRARGEHPTWLTQAPQHREWNPKPEAVSARPVLLTLHGR